MCFYWHLESGIRDQYIGVSDNNYDSRIIHNHEAGIVDLMGTHAKPLDHALRHRLLRH